MRNIILKSSEGRAYKMFLLACFIYYIYIQYVISYTRYIIININIILVNTPNESPLLPRRVHRCVERVCRPRSSNKLLAYISNKPNNI